MRETRAEDVGRFDGGELYLGTAVGLGAGPIDHEFVGVLVGRECWRDGWFDDERRKGLESTANNWHARPLRS